MSDMPNITPDSLLSILENLKTEYGTVIDQLDVNASAPALGEWNPRQVLSHVIGSLQRAPIQAGYFIAGVPGVPVVFSDPYWIDAWHDAPAESFKAAFVAAIEGNKALVSSLAPEVLWRTLPVAGFGDTPLAVFLIVNYQNHIKDAHLHQLSAFVGAAQPT